MEVPSDGNFTNEELNAAFKEATRGYKGVNKLHITDSRIETNDSSQEMS